MPSVSADNINNIAHVHTGAHLIYQHKRCSLLIERHVSYFNVSYSKKMLQVILARFNLYSTNAILFSLKKTFGSIVRARVRVKLYKRLKCTQKTL